MHPILADHPRWVEHEAKLADLEAREQAWRGRAEAIAAEYREAVKSWKAPTQAARESGADPPPPPAPPVEDRRASWFLDQRRALLAEGKKLLAEIGPDLEQAAAAREAELVGETLSLLDQLRPVARELESLGSVLARVRQQTYSHFTPATRPRTRTEISPAELVRLVEADERPLAPLPYLRASR